MGEALVRKYIIILEIPLKPSRASVTNCGSETCRFFPVLLGILRYVGGVDFAAGVWLGVELRSPAQSGRHGGSVNQHRYFSCRPGHGVLVQASAVTVQGVGADTLLSPRQQLEAEPADPV